MVAHRLGNSDLGLPHALGAALGAPVQKQDDGPSLAVVALPIFRQVHLKAVGDAVQLDAAVQESGFLRRHLPGFRLGQARLLRRGLACGGQDGGGHQADNGDSRQAVHDDLHHNDDSR